MTTTIITAAEAEQLAAHEATIAAGLATFYAVGAALVAIRDGKLYRATHATFEDYCRGKWQMGRAHAYRLIDAAAVVERVSPIGDIPANEAQARALAAVPVEQQAEVWAAVVETAPPAQRTAKLIETTAARHDTPSAPPLEEIPHKRFDTPAGWGELRLGRVAHAHARAVLAQPGTVYLGRGDNRFGLPHSPLHNPLRMEEESEEERERVCLGYALLWEAGYLPPAAYREFGHLRDRLQGGESLFLLCHCYPLPCHGDTIVEELLEGTTPPKGAPARRSKPTKAREYALDILQRLVDDADVNDYAEEVSDREWTEAYAERVQAELQALPGELS